MLERRELRLVSLFEFESLNCIDNLFSGPGDSGSSFYLIENSLPVLIGVVSSGIKRLKIPCKIENYAMFTDVFKFKNWIESTIKSEI